MTDGDPGNGETDFFVSYTGIDKDWAEWVAWVLEEANYSVVIQAWDFLPGDNFFARMDLAMDSAARTVAVLSDAYLRSKYAKAEWQAAWKRDPLGKQRKLLVFRVEDCLRPGVLGQVVSVDLFGVDREVARRRVLEAALGTRGKPAQEPTPGFSPRRLATPQPRFPPELRAAARRGARTLWSLVGVAVAVSVVTAVVVAAANLVPGWLRDARAAVAPPNTRPTVTESALGPIDVVASGPGPWTIEGQGYRYEITGAVRTRAAPFPAWWESPVPAISVQGFVTRVEPNEFTSMSAEVRDENSQPLTGASGTAPDSPGNWETKPTLGQRLPIEIVVYDTASGTSTVTLTITDFHRPDEGLIIRSIPVTGG